ncbi:MAG: MFS transporter [Bacteroidota bacterium]|nr:MFS transporter [Bacteroidota bacterium]
MKTIHYDHRSIADILALCLIPISGFATDIYLPSLPSMTTSLGASMGEVQLSVMIFMVSGGISQLFVGSLLDCFGRFRLSNAALLIFSLASFCIAWFPDLHVLYILRAIQGMAVAFIIVAKRAHFMDLYTGERLKHFTSMFSIIWSVAPIIAPFFGGYLQKAFGWQSNFYFLGGMTFLILLFTLRYGGETNKSFHVFEFKPIARIYGSMLGTRDFVFALLILGLSFGMVMLFGMASPFIIEHTWHFSPVVAGYCALLSGVSLMTGGIISKTLIRKPLHRKIPIALVLQFISASLLISSSVLFTPSVFVMMAFVIVQHIIVGFVFNNFYAYSLGRFSQNAGVSSGLSGGGFYVFSSLFSYGSASLLAVKSQMILGVAYLLLTIGVVIMYLVFKKTEPHPVKPHNIKPRARVQLVAD